MTTEIEKQRLKERYLDLHKRLQDPYLSKDFKKQLEREEHNAVQEYFIKTGNVIADDIEEEL